MAHFAGPPSALPSGTVTFLFTDIEGSTRLWESQSEAMHRALARHDVLMRKCVEGSGGHVVKTTGDGLMAAFPVASGAMRAALAAQQALDAEPWPAPIRIRARMSLNSGSAQLRDGDYFGPAVIRTARLMSLGHGGQTLLSRAAHDLCCDLLPEGVELKPLGEFSLKDLAREETVFQLCYPGVGEFPPLHNVLPPIDTAAASIAVLPFVDMSKDGGNEYFGDGLAEELLNLMAKIRGLHVVSRTSAFSFKGKDVDIRSVARKLGVATVLEGSVRVAGRRVRITAQLIAVSTDSHLWSQTYDRELDDIFAVQDEIAGAVVDELRSSLLGEKAEDAAGPPSAAAARGQSRNAEARALYLRGRFFLGNRFARHDLVKAAPCFRRAVELDPAFALAWAGLSFACMIEANEGPLAMMTGGYARAREAAERSLQIEPRLTEGHMVLGHVRLYHDWDWTMATASFERALAISPGSAEVVRMASTLALYQGGCDAVALAERAVALDPLAVTAYTLLSRAYVAAGRLADAESALKTLIDLDSRGASLLAYLAKVHVLQGRATEALALLDRESDELDRVFGQALAHHALGDTSKADAALRTFIEKFADIDCFSIALVHAYRGETDSAFAWLERAYAQRDPGLVSLRMETLLRSLHGDPRWMAFLEKMNLAPDHRP